MKLERVKGVSLLVPDGLSPAQEVGMQIALSMLLAAWFYAQ